MVKIIQTNKDGSQKKIVCCIARNDSFGASIPLKIPVSSAFFPSMLRVYFLQTLDYLGDMIAGGEFEKFAKGAKKDKNFCDWL